MKEATLIFPNQLFAKHPAIKKGRLIFLAEEYLFFKVQLFHKQRLVLLRAAMRQYAAHLRRQGHEVHYMESQVLAKRGALFERLEQERVTHWHIVEFEDDWLQHDINSAAAKHKWQVHWHPSPMFLCSLADLCRFFQAKDNFSMAQFYIFQRRRFSILMDEGKPAGGKFSYDIKNRRKIPKDLSIPSRPFPDENSFTKEARSYVLREFPNAIGEAQLCLYPTNHQQAALALEDFIENRFSSFGDYEDAIVENESCLFHSVLSPLLNIGLLTPLQVLQSVLRAHYERSIPLNSTEGFVRQIIGWREFMRACYLFKGRTQRLSNYFQHTSDLPKGFWNGTTGIEPIDSTIKKVLKTGYCHHIERLMLLGNFLLLNESSPSAIYTWFMACFVDAYDWVMVPNVYAMSQYADEGSITTKPYISGSNYILRMSNYSKGSWTEVWDGLYWRFIEKHKDLFQRNVRTKGMVALLKKNRTTIGLKIRKAEDWLNLGCSAQRSRC